MSATDPKLKPKTDRVFPLTGYQFKMILMSLGYIFFIYGMVSTYADNFTPNGVHPQPWEVVWFVVGCIYIVIMSALFCVMGLSDTIKYIQRKTRIRFRDPYKDNKYTA